MTLRIKKFKIFRTMMNNLIKNSSDNLNINKSKFKNQNKKNKLSKKIKLNIHRNRMYLQE
jgi:hypothetical protein